MLYTGRKVSVGIAKEGTRGLATVPSLYYAHVDFQPQDRVEYKENEGVIGTLAQTHKKEIVQKYSEIPLKGTVWLESIGYFFLALLGSVSSAETAGTGAYQHDFSLLNDNIHPSFTLTEKNGVEGLAYSLWSMEKLAFDFQQGAYVMLDSNWKAKISETMALTPSYSEEKEFLAREIQIFFADDLAGLDSADEVCIESGSIELTKQIEQIFCLGDIAPKDVIFKALDLQANLTIRHTATTYSDYQKNGTNKAMRIRMIDPNTTIGVSDNPTIEIDVPKVSFDDVVKEGGRDDIIKQNITISGLFDLTTSKLVTGKVINTTNTY